MKTVLAPVDFSAVTRKVIDEAIVIARSVEARLVLLHVVQPAAVIASEFAETNALAVLTRERERAAVSKLKALQRQLCGEGVTAHVVHRVGVAGQQILEQAERLEADYIVMGSHGHGAFYDLIVGSTTSRVLKRAKCPLVVVPARVKQRSKLSVAVREQPGAAELQPSPQATEVV